MYFFSVHRLFVQCWLKKSTSGILVFHFYRLGLFILGLRLHSCVYFFFCCAFMCVLSGRVYLAQPDETLKILYIFTDFIVYLHCTLTDVKKTHTMNRNIYIYIKY